MKHSARRGLGSPKQIHTQRADSADATLQVHLEQATRALHEGRCHAAHRALMDASEMQGNIYAHTRESGGKAPWHHARLWMDANGMFNDRCLRVSPTDRGAESLSGARSRAPQRKGR